MKTLIALATAGLMFATPASAQHPRPRDIVDTAVAAGSFETLVAAAQAAGLVDALKGEGPLTVFAPTDEAFAKLPAGTVESLLKPENKDQLVAVLTYHVVAGKVGAVDALQAGDASTLQGEAVTFRLDGGRLQVNESNVITNDIPAANGVIHVIDQVLLPPEPQGRKVVGIYTEGVGNTTRGLLGLDSGEGIGVSSLVRGGPSQDAGLMPGDVIVAIDGEIAAHGVLDAAKERTRVGDTIEFLVARRVQVAVSVEDD
jgi:uncharacterized surface protein with fasciclin (FAS1) repeats